MEKYDFSGYATRANMKCSDGRTILKDAFKHCDGQVVPLVWSHQHADPERVLGHALLENREDGVYTYASFNDSPNAQHAKLLVQHGDITSLSIYANQLKENMGQVMHGVIREVSLVLAGANPGACIDNILCHADGEDDAVIYSGEELELYHADEEPKQEKKEVAEENDKTVQEVWNDILKKTTEDEQNVIYAIIDSAFTDSDSDDKEEKVEHSEGGENSMKTNVFDQGTQTQANGVSLTHADEMNIIALAKQSNVGSFKQAMRIFAEESGALQHSEDGYGVFEDYEVLFPELELLKKGEPETIFKHEMGWVRPALNKIHKSPFSRIRTRHADARIAELKAKGYQKKGDEKKIMGQITMINRETTPQTIYIKDNLHRDDIVDIIDFSIVAYQWNMMRLKLDETMVLAAMVGDGRDALDPDKIHENNIRPIWQDNEEYTIHWDVDVEAARKELQGTETNAHFGENYIYAEAIITAALYSREKFKGTGTPDFYCTPHLVNVMLLARDLNGRRIYDSKSDLAKALNCNSIIEVEQFEGLTRTTEEGDTKKLLGLFVNLNDYTFGSTKGGEITKFENFDMDFNVQKFMLETRLSGSLYKLKSAIALEEPVETSTIE